ncbi:MAG TPA: PAS domain-containing protein [Longimicrobium sp.]
MAFGEIREFIDAHAPRLQSLQAQTRSRRAGELGPAHEALAELGLALEELRVSEEELRLQSELLANAQQSLHAERERYRRLFADLPTACIMTDAAGVVREANGAAGELLGIAERSLVGKPLAVFVVESDRAALRSRLVRSFADAGDGDWEVRIQPRKRDPLHVRARVSVTGDSGLVWMLHDSVRSPRPTQNLADENVLAGAILDALPMPACALDLDGTILRWNRAAAATLGWTGEMAGVPCPVRFPAHDDGIDDILVSRERMDGIAAELRRPNGTELRMRASVAPILAGDTRRGSLLTFTEVEEEGRSTVRDSADSVGMEGWGFMAGAGAGVYERLRDWIASGLHLGHLRPGSRLPSIRVVVETSGAEHRAVAGVYRALASEGLVEVRSRQGAFVAAPVAPETPVLGETAEWLAGVLEGAGALRIRIPQVADLVRRWTTSAQVKCACLESVEDERAALVGEMAGQWGMDAFPVSPGGARVGEGAYSIPEALHGAHMIVTTSFHASEAQAAGRVLGIPVLVLCAGTEMVQAAEERLASGALTAVVHDPAYAARLSFLRGSDRLRVVMADDAAGLASIPQSESVLLTLAARQRLGDAAPRMLVPLSSFVARTPARTIASLLIHHNVTGARRNA